MAITLPDHSTEGGAGPGQPIHVEQIGQSYVEDRYAPGGIAVDSSSLHPGKYLAGLILNRVYRLLSKMVESLQNTAVAQAERLEVMTDWQNAYNTKKSSIHSFVSNNTDPGYISGTDTSLNTKREDLNNVNSNYTEQMRANSNIISDDAKALQTVINQTQDAVNKASNMATSLVQQFSTILSAIYR
jgi:hypothetical protein